MRRSILAWNFFDRAGVNPILWVRVKAGEQFGDWRVCERRERRRWWHLFFNARGNLRLLERGQMERALDEIEHDKFADFSTSVTYEILRRWAASFATPGENFQFKITETQTEALVSKVHQA